MLGASQFFPREPSSLERGAELRSVPIAAGELHELGRVASVAQVFVLLREPSLCETEALAGYGVSVQYDGKVDGRPFLYGDGSVPYG